MQPIDQNNNDHNSDHSQTALPELTEELKTDNNEGAISETEIASWSKHQLADKLREYLDTEDIQAVFSSAQLIKAKFDELVKENYAHKLNAYLQSGGIAEDFEPKPDPLDIEIEQIWKNFNNKRTTQRKQREQSSQENLAIKKLIIEELKELLKGNEKLPASYQKFQALQSKWRATGNVPPSDQYTLKENYFFYVGKFYDMVKINNELNELDKKKNTEHKIQLCEKAEQLVAEPSLKKAINGLKYLQEEWREIRNTPKEQNDALWVRFKTATDKIIERQKKHTQQVNQQQQENLAAKLALCVQMEQLPEQVELTSHKACQEASQKAEAIWEAWQKIGFVPKSDNGNCWKRFKKAQQHFYRLLDIFYAKQRTELGANLEKKIALCLKAEELQKSTDWQATTEVLKKLQAEWKTIGQVPVKDSNAIWNRFRNACNHFFDSKANKNLEKDNALKANIQLREALIAKVDSTQPASDINQSLDELKKLQEEWLHAGDVPLKINDQLNNAFGNAIEKLLERIKSNAQVDDKLFYRLKYEQMLQSPQGVSQINNERRHLQDKISRLQAEANQLENNLGFFGKSKKENPLIAQYREQVDNLKAEIKTLQTKLKSIPVV